MTIDKEAREKAIKHQIENKDLIIAEKRNSLIHGDNIHFQVKVNPKSEANKAESDSMTDPDKLNIEVVINTTNLIDSHNDCHIPGIWNKSLNEMKTLFLLQEHQMDFDKIIADSVNDELKANVRNMSWSELGVDYAGTTQALIFTASISKSRNEFMFKQYMNGYVLNHSVGMRYVKIFLCVDSENPNYAAEKENWEKYYPSVMNKEKADESGYFYAVTEAVIVEGSAVVKGSNGITPTLNVEETKEIKDNGAAESTPGTEAASSTSKQSTKKVSVYL